MSNPRRVILIAAGVLVLGEVVLLLSGYGIPFFLFILLGLAAANYIMWRRDEAYQAGLQSEPEDDR